MSTIEESIQQLHDTTIQHQTAINSIQTTLAAQQNDIAAIRTSINHMIRSVSEIATKLGFQITLPQPLPLLSTSPTMLSAAAPTASTTPSFPLDRISPDSASPARMPTKSETSIFSNPQPTTPQPLSPTPNPSPPAQIHRSLLLVHTSVLTPTSSLTNNLPKLLFTNSSFTQMHSSTLYIAYQRIPRTYSEAATSEAYSICKVLIGVKNNLKCESKVYIFDPGGIFDIMCIFDLKVFDTMRREGKKPNITTWNALIRGYCKIGNVKQSHELFNKMQEEGLYPNPNISITIISQLGERGKWSDIKKFFESIKGRGMHESGVIYAVLVDIYGQYGMYEGAEECVATLKAKGLVLSANGFCVPANAYAQQGFYEETVNVLRLIEVEGSFSLIFDSGGIIDVKQLGWRLTLRTRSVSEGTVMMQSQADPGAP